MKWKTVNSITLSTAMMCTYMSALKTYVFGRYVTPDGYTIVGEVKL